MSWKDTVGRASTAGRAVIKRVAGVASEVAGAGVESLTNVDPAIVAETVGHVIQLADAGGMLNDPKAASLKAVAGRLAGGEQVPPLELIELVPDVLQMDLARRVLPKGKMTDRAIMVMNAAVAAHRLGRMIKEANAHPSAPEPEAAATPAAEQPSTPAPADPPAKRRGRGTPRSPKANPGPGDGGLAA